jgi:hypothetical protein
VNVAEDNGIGLFQIRDCVAIKFIERTDQLIGARA